MRMHWVWIAFLTFGLVCAQDSDIKSPIKDWSFIKYEGDEVVCIIKGEQAVPLGSGRFDITKPQATLYTKPERKGDRSRKIIISARKGNYNDQSKLLLLSGGVKATLDKTAHLSTEQLKVYIGTRILETHREFTWVKDTLTCTGKYLKAEENLNKVTISNGIRITKQEGDNLLNCAAERGELLFDHDTQELLSIRAEGRIKFKDNRGMQGSAEMFLWDRGKAPIRLKSRSLSRLEKDSHTVEAPEILLYRTPDILLLRGPKRVIVTHHTDSIRTYNVVAGGTILFNTSNHILRIGGGVSIQGSDFHLRAQDIFILLSEDHRKIRMIKARGGVKIRDLPSGTLIHGDILEKDFSSGRTIIQGLPYTTLKRENLLMKVGQVTIGTSGRIIGEQGKLRSSLTFYIGSERE
jgi:hypothetical protein